MSDQEEEKTLGNKRNVKFIVMFVAIILLVAAGSSLLTVNVAKRNPEPFGLLKGPSIVQKEEKELIELIGTHIDLPEEETPTLATVSDKSKLEGQEFFRNSQDGDKLLIYTETGKVILYRPSEDRVVEVGTVNINDQGEEEISEDVEVISFLLLNGTQSDTVIDDVENSIKEAYQDAIFERSNSLNVYNQSIIVDVIGDKNDQAQQLSTDLGISLGNLPAAEEIAEGVDIVIIIGADRLSPEPTSQITP